MKGALLTIIILLLAVAPIGENQISQAAVIYRPWVEYESEMYSYKKGLEVKPYARVKKKRSKGIYFSTAKHHSPFPKKNIRKNKYKNIYTTLVFIALPIAALIFGLVWLEWILIWSGGIFTALLLLFILAGASIVWHNKKNLRAAFILFLVGAGVSGSIFMGISFLTFIIGLILGHLVLWSVSLGIVLLGLGIYFWHRGRTRH